MMAEMEQTYSCAVKYNTVATLEEGEDLPWSHHTLNTLTYPRNAHPYQLSSPLPFLLEKYLPLSTHPFPTDQVTTQNAKTNRFPPHHDLETYTAISTSPSSESKSDDDATLIGIENEDKTHPDEKGLYPLTRSAPRSPCQTCTYLSAQLAETRSTTSSLVSAIEDATLFLHHLDTSPSLATQISHRGLLASNERLLQRNTALVAETQRLKHELRDCQEQCKVFCELGVELEQKLEVYRKLNEELVRGYVRVKRERGEMRGEVLRARNAREAACVRGEVSGAQMFGLVVVLVWFGWDVINLLVWL